MCTKYLWKHIREIFRMNCFRNANGVSERIRWRRDSIFCTFEIWAMQIINLLKGPKSQWSSKTCCYSVWPESKSCYSVWTSLFFIHHFLLALFLKSQDSLRVCSIYTSEHDNNINLCEKEKVPMGWRQFYCRVEWSSMPRRLESVEVLRFVSYNCLFYKWEV